MLHARALEFRLPGAGEWLRLEAPYDEAFRQVLAKLAG
jgi:23S rRNA pseudouridine955/2504/2580 synthase